MKFKNPPTYNVSHLENKASKLVVESLGHDFQVPVDVELILELLPGVILDVYPCLKSNHQTEGMVCRDVKSGELLVFIDDAIADHQNKNRYRMTVAEELGHVVLHKSVIEQVTKPEDFLELQRHSQWHEMDRNAKRFAAAVLMPADRVLAFARELYPRLVAAAGFGNVAAVVNQIAARGAERFEVSYQAMGYRLKEYPARVVTSVENAMRDEIDYI